MRTLKPCSFVDMAFLLAILLLAYASDANGQDASLPRYDHILVIIAENHGYDQIIGNSHAPNLNRLAQLYGLASKFYGEVHPSEGNYVAMISGDTFGIHDDDAWYCSPGRTQKYCEHAEGPDYRDHTVSERNLVDQLKESGLTWKGYYETIPSPGSKAIYYPAAESPVLLQPNNLYASKHNGFIKLFGCTDGSESCEQAGRL